MSFKQMPGEFEKLEGQLPSSVPKPLVTSPSSKARWIKAMCLAVLLPTILYHVATPSCLHKRSQFRGQQWAFEALEAARSEDALSTAEVEKLFLSVPNAESALAASRAYATHPHLAASKEDYEDALVILKLFQDEFNISAPNKLPVFPAGSDDSRSATLGINKLTKPAAWVDTYYPVMNAPLDLSVQILSNDGSVAWNADLVEDGDPADPDAAKYRDYIPTFHGYSADGDVQGPLIYANYGTQDDYQELLAKGTNFTGKIVLTRYGGILRGLKVKGAQDLGAIGTIIYTDPRDDGTVTVENGYVAYPHGPARNPSSVERGSVQLISMYPGDPTTPGYPAYENATRTDSKNVPKIPSLPVSWANAQRLLAEITTEGDARKLTGQASERVIRVINHMDYKVMPIWNTVAALPGHIKHETVLIGGHRDAWVMGAADPTSGQVSLREVVKGFGALLKQGWKPLRNIVIVSWDAEETGLIGSTEWAEDFGKWIGANVVTYMNLDSSVAGSRWFAGASPSLAHVIRASAEDIPHPTVPGKTLWDAREDVGPYVGETIDTQAMSLYEKAAHRSKSSDTGTMILGSGSDFTPFLQHIGIASMDQEFGGTPYDAVYHYHSIYDSQRWQEVYADPGFHRHVAVAQELGLVALRLADSIILPLNTTQYTLELDDYLDGIEELAASLSLSVDFSPLRESIANVQDASRELDVEKADAGKTFKELFDKLPKTKPGHGIINWIKWLLGLRNFPVLDFIKAAKRVQKANTKLVAFEKGFISEDGIKDRTWYKHLGVAPGKWLGYGATTLPSIYDALAFDKNVTAATLEVARVSEMVDKLSDMLVS